MRCDGLIRSTQNTEVLAAAELLVQIEIRARVKAALKTLRREGTGSSTFPIRALLLGEPPLVDAGEITDKGYINQSMVQRRRATLVSTLYTGSPEVELLESLGHL